MSSLTRVSALLLAGTTLVFGGAFALRSSEFVTMMTESPSALRISRINVGNGITLHVVERGNRNGTPVVLLHGLSDSWASFSRLYEHLPLDLRLISVDLRGHGESSKTASAHTTRMFAEDIVAVLDSLGVSRAHIVGHSMGSFVAQHLASMRPDRVGGMILIGSARSASHFAGIGDLESVIQQFPATDASIPEPFIREFQYGSVYLPVPAAFMDSAIAASRKLPARAWHEIIADLVHGPEAMVTRPVHTLVLSGERDGLLTEKEPSLLAAKWQAKFFVFPETGHSPHWERPAQTAKVMLEFWRTTATN